MIDTSFWKAGEIQPSFLANIDKAYRDEAKAVFLCLMQKKKSQIRLNLRLLAEMVGFEPTCPVKDKTISSRSRYDHFDTSPYSVPLESRGGLISRTIQA